ncbi:unnamed protein product [Ceratitis capitata]|uniref:(Mediterranean fruit fly) hypothetical protein n=1 Tax=Ceratitis capitata TaxID=7213 RepID=A0A811UMP1_CERCA|nr:unnamed protein product [Ceratitis capitata]
MMRRHEEQNRKFRQVAEITYTDHFKGAQMAPTIATTTTSITITIIKYYECRTNNLDGVCESSVALVVKVTWTVAADGGVYKTAGAVNAAYDYVKPSWRKDKQQRWLEKSK